VERAFDSILAAEELARGEAIDRLDQRRGVGAGAAARFDQFVEEALGIVIVEADRGGGSGHEKTRWRGPGKCHDLTEREGLDDACPQLR
jgi:hypothetical protein